MSLSQYQTATLALGQFVPDSFLEKVAIVFLNAWVFFWSGDFSGKLAQVFLAMGFFEMPPQDVPSIEGARWAVLKDFFSQSDVFFQTVLEMDVSKNRGYPQIIHFNRIFHYKPSILGENPYFLETPKLTPQRQP